MIWKFWKVIWRPSTVFVKNQCFLKWFCNFCILNIFLFKNETSCGVFQQQIGFGPQYLIILSYMKWLHFNDVLYLQGFEGQMWMVERLVCNYGPSGNYFNAPVYKQGEPCSQCPNGTKCSDMYPGLCQSK